jgi:hypothetical protein
VADAIATGAAISVVNLAEVLTKLAEAGKDPQQARDQLRVDWVIDELRPAPNGERWVTYTPATEAAPPEARSVRARMWGASRWTAEADAVAGSGAYGKRRCSSTSGG